MGYSPWDHKESETINRLKNNNNRKVCTHTHTSQESSALKAAGLEGFAPD